MPRMHDDADATKLLDELDAELAQAPTALFGPTVTIASMEQAYQRLVQRIDPRLFVLTSREIQQRVLACNQRVRNLYWEAILKNADAIVDDDGVASSRVTTKRIRRSVT